jgi:hypothetical protein
MRLSAHDRPGAVRTWALLACTTLLLAFATLAWLAASTKSPTYDEPYHALSAWTQLHRFDYRMDAEDPPLWKFLVALPNGSHALHANFDSPEWTQQPQKQWLQWQWTVNTLYETPGNDADRFVARSRAVMLAIGVGLGVVICYWAWQLGGPVAAVVAGGLFCLDPNFLAHAPLVKNDVLLSLAMAWLAIVLWRLGQGVTWMRAAGLVTAVGVMLTAKWSGVLALALVPILLSARAIAAQPWPALGRRWTSRPGRALVAAGLTLSAWTGGYTALWAAYGFRFAPTPDPNVRFDTATVRQLGHMKEVETRNGDHAPSAAELAAAPTSTFLKAMVQIEQHHLLPQSCIEGLLFTYESALVRPEYLLGEFSATGWWYYFPVAMAVKTPLATLSAFLLAAAAAAVMAVRVDYQMAGPAIDRFQRRWAILCLAIPAALYLAWAMHSNLNIGLRHVLPVYPALFVGTGWIAAEATRRWNRPTSAAAILVTLWLATTTLAAYPNYIAFFNRAAGGSRGGLHLLADSNLDWGQDLKLLARWQQQNPNRKLYLAYFGFADPRAYGIRFDRLPGTQSYGPPPQRPQPGEPCVLAVSATFLQGLYLLDPASERYYTTLAKHKPMDVLGGTIYLYQLSGKSSAKVRTQNAE